MDLVTFESNAVTSSASTRFISEVKNLYTMLSSLNSRTVDTIDMREPEENQKRASRVRVKEERERERETEKS